jgi:Dyp-type peroxidase family
MQKTMPLFSLPTPLTESDLRTYDRELKLLQANILKSHGREAAVYIFLTFHEGKRNEARKFIHNFADRVTSAAVQNEQTRQFRERRGSADGSQLLTGLYLSAKGYHFLGHRTDTDDFCPAFHCGLKQARERLCDPKLDEWEHKFRRDIHAVVLFAHDYASQLGAELIKLRESLDGVASVSSEFGVTMRNPDGDAIEHFGYADGASQPIFFEADLPKKPQQHWDPSAGPNLVLVPDPHRTSDAECGSYVVFRKLEQNVKGFKEEERRVAERLKWKGDERELLGAMIVGRFENSTPVLLTKDEKYSGDKNDFIYDVDPEGRKCPYFAHVRKANPREGDGERERRIARRGITYGDPTPPGEDETTWPERGVGLLFHCCQADLAKQFETIQRRVNDCDFPTRKAGQDPLIGQTKKFGISVPARWGHPDRKDCSFGGFVHMRGGEYFFAPSIAALRRI